MALAPLATVNQLETWIRRELDPSETARATMLLGAASQLLRGVVGQDFTLAVDDDVTLRADSGSVVLPQRPVVEVTAVTYAGWRIGGAGLSGPVYGYGWDGIDTLSGVGTGTVTVTYTHGYAEIPEDVVAAVCASVARTLGDGTGATPDTSGVVEESIDDYRYKLATPAGTVGYTSEETSVLRRIYGRTAGTIRLRT